MSGPAYEIDVPAARIPTTISQPLGPGLLTGAACVPNGSEYIFPQSVYATIALSVDVSGSDALRLTLASGYINQNDPLSWTGQLYIPPSSFLIVIAQSLAARALRLMAWTATGPSRTPSPGGPDV